jgi:hypothetical protein
MTHHENDYGLRYVRESIERSQNDGFMYLRYHEGIAIRMVPMEDEGVAVIRKYLADHDLREMTADRTGEPVRDLSAALVQIDNLPSPVIIIGPPESIEGALGPDQILPSGDVIHVGSGGYTAEARHTAFSMAQEGSLEGVTYYVGDNGIPDRIAYITNGRDITHLTPAALILFADCHVDGIRGVNVYAEEIE